MTYAPRPGSIPTLEVPDVAALRAVHLVGIGGAGMSGIARLLLARGVEVSGSDLKDTPGLALLRGAGARVAVGHAAEQVDGADALVVSSAIREENVEVREAHARGIPVYARAQVLAALMREREGIAIAGAHGKTTTTSMVAVIFERAGLDPTYVIGGDLNESGSNARSGDGPHFIAEADESDGSFLLLRPAIAVVTNVEADHLDFYADAAEVEAAFEAFCAGAGHVIACIDDPGVRRVLEAAAVPAETYGEREGADARIAGVELHPGGGRCRLLAGEDRVDLEVPIPGGHSLLNAAAAVLVARRVGIDPAAAAESLRSFTGVRRRFEPRGEVLGARLVDDYAHHPSEIAATLAAARTEGPRRLIAVFQPHRYTRTRALWRELGASLGGADLVVLTDVYGAGEMPEPGVSGKLVVDSLVESSPRARAVYLPSRSEIAPFLASEVREGDLVLTMGAGDVTMVAEEVLALLAEEGRDGA